MCRDTFIGSTGQYTTARMSSSTDIEAQNEISQDFNHESELRRLKSAGAVTISPELFEKVFFTAMTDH